MLIMPRSHVRTLIHMYWTATRAPGCNLSVVCKNPLCHRNFSGLNEVWANVRSCSMFHTSIDWVSSKILDLSLGWSSFLFTGAVRGFSEHVTCQSSVSVVWPPSSTQNSIRDTSPYNILFCATHRGCWNDEDSVLYSWGVRFQFLPKYRISLQSFTWLYSVNATLKRPKNFLFFSLHSTLYHHRPFSKPDWLYCWQPHGLSQQPHRYYFYVCISVIPYL
jgi:hypothetical protein